MLKLKTCFSQFFSVSNLVATAHSVLHKIGPSRVTDTILGLNEAYNLYFDMMGLTRYQAPATSDSLCQNGSHILFY